MSRRTSSVTRFAVHPGVYKDSLVLMQLHQRLLDRPGVLDAGAAMASLANLELLAAGGLLPEPIGDLQAEDLLVVVRAEDDAAAAAALESLDELLAVRPVAAAGSFRPRSLDGALSRLGDARWVTVSVPGEYAARVTEDALDRGLNVFLYSDNVPVGDEVRLKTLAASRGHLLLGPDCGTALIAGTGLGFANHVRSGDIGLVGGSGTGLQAVSAAIHDLGGGISQAIGTGGRDLSLDVGGITTHQALRLLAEDPQTRVIALVSKSPSRQIAERVLAWAADCGKPVVAYLQGYGGGAPAGVRLAPDLDAVAPLALNPEEAAAPPKTTSAPFLQLDDASDSGFLRGLFAGGTLAAEALLRLRHHLQPLHSNLSGEGWRQLDDVFASQGHTVLDLGADELTRGRLHPMIDQESRLRRLESEAADPEVSRILLDVVLGEGAHPDPAAELAPAIEAALSAADGEGRRLEVVAVVIGTEDDPQDLASQIARLEAAGATVRRTLAEAVPVGAPSATAPDTTGAGDRAGDTGITESETTPVDPAAIRAPLAAVNIGLESFHASLLAQGAEAVHVDWRPPAGGRAHLADILDRLRQMSGARTEVTQG